MKPAGTTFAGGKQLNTFSRNELHQFIVLVEQNSVLFNRTLRENICYSKTTYTKEQLEQALYISCCDEFINTLPNGLDTRIGENGLVLSGGQIQRISIARAVLFNPKILILDESTSGLEKELESRVISNLVAVKNQSLIVISHSKDLVSVIPKVVSFTASPKKFHMDFCNQGAIVCQS